jgi:hypothetical protein
MKRKTKRKLNYWRVVVVYTDNETSANRVFHDLDRAKTSGQSVPLKRSMEFCADKGQTGSHDIAIPGRTG